MSKRFQRGWLGLLATALALLAVSAPSAATASVSVALQPIATFFPGGAFDTAVTQQYLGAGGHLTVDGPACSGTLHGLKPATSYTMWLDADGANAGDESTNGPVWSNVGTFSSDFSGNAAFACTDALPVGSTVYFNETVANVSVMISGRIPAPSGLNTGLISHWQLDGTAQDTEGTNDGNTVGGSFEAGHTGLAFRSSGQSSVVSVPDNDSLDLPAFAIALWVRHDATNFFNEVLVWKGNGAGADVSTPYGVGIGGSVNPSYVGRPFFLVTDGASSQFVVASSPLPTAVFTHVAVTVDGSRVRLYVNGVLAAEAPQTVTPGNSAFPFQMGGLANNTVNSNSLRGLLDDVRFYGRSLAPCEVATLAGIGTCDSTPPAIASFVSGTLGGSGWYTDDVGLDWSVDEPESPGSLSTTGCLDVSVTADQQATTYSCSASSLGGSAGPVEVAIKRDATAPSLDCGSPAPAFHLGEAGALVTASVSDATSGPAAASLSAAADTATVGAKSASLTGSDNAGNETTAACGYRVGYDFSGFFQPVDNGVLNVARAGRAIPLKWRLTDASGTPITNLPAAPISTVTLNCGTLSEGTDAIEEYAAGASGLQNLGDGYYQLNWKSPSTYAGSCRRLRLDLGEGAFRTADFQFTA